MKIKFDDDRNTDLFYKLTFVFISILFFFMVYRFEGFKNGFSRILEVLSPVIFGGVLAWLLNIPLRFFERNLNKIESFSKLSFRKRRNISLTITYILVIFLIIVFFSLLIPELTKSVASFTYMINDYLSQNKFSSWETIFNEYGLNPQVSEFLIGLLTKLTQYLKGILTKIGPILTSLASGLISTAITFLIGFFISLYILSSKEHFGEITKKTTYAIFPKKVAEKLIEIFRDLGNNMKSFLTGSLIGSIILGVEVSIALVFLGVEGIFAMGLILTITNIVPYIGPWIGAIPVFIMIGVQDIEKALIFVVIILIAQQIDGNIVKPRIQSEQMGMNSFWIIFSIIIGGSLFGILGMVIGVPIFTVFYTLMKELVEYLLQRKGLPKELKAYRKENEKNFKKSYLENYD